jgi:hypothetical protein
MHATQGQKVPNWYIIEILFKQFIKTRHKKTFKLLNASEKFFFGKKLKNLLCFVTLFGLLLEIWLILFKNNENFKHGQEMKEMSITHPKLNRKAFGWMIISIPDYRNQKIQINNPKSCPQSLKKVCKSLLKLSKASTSLGSLTSAFRFQNWWKNTGRKLVAMKIFNETVAVLLKKDVSQKKNSVYVSD